MEDSGLRKKHGHTGLTRLVYATHFSLRGLRAAWRNEEGFRLECYLLLILTPVAGWLAQELTQFLLMISAGVLVILAELLNSALEALVDRIGTEQHPLSGQAKDIGSAAVFVCMLLFLVIWGAVLWQHFTAA